MGIDAKLLDGWIAELESGKREQAQGALAAQLNENDPAAVPVYGYCCLGVLDLTNGKDLIAELEGDRLEEDYPLSGSCGLQGSVIHTLARGNDKGMTFSEIAKVLKDNRACLISNGTFKVDTLPPIILGEYIAAKED